MNNEIKKAQYEINILSNTILDDTTYKPTIERRKILYNYITNLQEENKEWGLIFDTFSKRPYAHRYLEEKRKELGKDKIIGLDSEMIYKDYYALQEENERLKEKIKSQDKLLNKLGDDVFNRTNNWVRATDERNDYKSRCEKADEFIQKTPFINDITKLSIHNILQNGSEEK